ncbi:MAG: hypothetical protein ABEJ78_11245 [Haloferacaceae archaeon]
MSNQAAQHDVNQRELPDYLQIVSNALYALAGALFLGGLYFDWQRSGEIIIPFFAIADEPEANSGLFLAAMVALAVGWVLSKIALKIVDLRTEKVDQTQEWTVDVGE